jgi:hypothetical protein
MTAMVEAGGNTALAVSPCIREWLVYSEDEVQSKNFIVLNTEDPKTSASKIESWEAAFCMRCEIIHV